MLTAEQKAALIALGIDSQTVEDLVASGHFNWGPIATILQGILSGILAGLGGGKKPPAPPTGG